MSRAISDGVSTLAQRPVEEFEATVQSRRWTPKYLPIKKA